MASAATPTLLLNALAARKTELQEVEIVSISTLGAMPIASPDCKGSFYINSLFVSENVRQAVNGDQGGYVPIFLSEIGHLFRKTSFPLTLPSSMFPNRMPMVTARWGFPWTLQNLPSKLPRSSLPKSTSKCQEPMATDISTSANLQRR
jgi:hypothetical protein